MIRLEQPIIVEGKYDKIALENVIDALIIPTDGFGIFKNREKCAMIRRLAAPKGIVIMTDSDSAGGVIRAYLKKIVGEAEIFNVYIPQLKGKEKRKASASKEGFLGVEGMTPQVLREALVKGGVMKSLPPERRRVTKTDFFILGVSGKTDSVSQRISFLKFLGLPEKLSSSAMLDVVNNMFDYNEFEEKAKLWQNSTDKN